MIGWDWLVENRQWVFSGIGVLALSALATGTIYLFRRVKLARAARPRSRANLVPLVFLKPRAPYNPGEVAGFERPMAERYVDVGIARYYRRRDRLYAWWRALIRLGGSER